MKRIQSVMAGTLANQFIPGAQLEQSMPTAARSGWAQDACAWREQLPHCRSSTEASFQAKLSQMYVPLIST
ncbi:MAG: hypothetical protein AAGA85_28600 [Bacteroidota bacterium]